MYEIEAISQSIPSMSSVTERDGSIYIEHHSNSVLASLAFVDIFLERARERPALLH